MKREILSRRYAEALADVAEQAGELTRVRDELTGLADAVADSRAFYVAVRSPRKQREEKRQFFADLCERLGYSDYTRRLLLLLVEKRRAELLPDLARAFARVADRRTGVASAQITSAEPLTDEQRDRIRKRIESIIDRQIRIEERVDEDLIAGFQVRLDGKFYDGSLRARLQRIKERIAHAG
jgi:F-type H+-transporting ATPase subunit delta